MGMFSTKGEREAPAPTGGLSVIAAGMGVRGDIDSDGTVKVEGSVNGNVQARNQVLVAKGGVVHGDIDAREAIVGGTVEGAIRAAERVEVQSGAAVQGDITTLRISVAEGGAINGAIRMGEQAAERKPAAARPEVKNTPVPATPTSTPALVRPSVPVARVAVPPRAPTSGSGH